MEDKRYRILLVEDDRLDQMAFKRLVKEEDLPYDYTIAGSVAQATEILGGEKFDLVFVDYLLGDGTAFDILESIVDTPAVFATGTGSEELAVKAMKSGASDYLIKDPSRNYLKVLPEIVKNAIRHKKAEDELKQYHEKLVELVKERTEQLAEEKEVLAVTLSSMGDAVVAVDAQNRITLFNKTAEQLTGWRFEEVQGKPVDEIIRIVNEQTKQPANSPIDRVLESREIESGTDHDALIARIGRECPISATAAPIRRNDGTMTGIVMVLRDVSQQREIDRMKSDFISSVSHELRTPLTSIKAYAETMLDDRNMTARNKAGVSSNHRRGIRPAHQPHQRNPRHFQDRDQAQSKSFANPSTSPRSQNVPLNRSNTSQAKRKSACKPILRNICRNCSATKTKSTR